MKNVRQIFLLCMLALSLTNCKKEQVGTVTFDVNSEVNFTIPPNTVLDIPAIITPGITTDWNGDFSNNNTNKDKIKKMILSNLKLVIKDPPGKTFSFLKDIDIYIQAEGLQETLIAYRHDIPATVGQSLDLIPVDVDLAPYAKKDSFKLRINSKPDEYNQDYVQVNSQVTFQVTADVLK